VKPSWHGQETLLDHRPTLEEARLIAHNWEPVWEPLFRKTKVTDETTGRSKTVYLPVEDFQAVVRNDNQKMLHAANPKTFGLFPNYGLYEIMEVFLGQGAELETNGTVNGGRQVYVLAYLNEP